MRSKGVANVNTERKGDMYVIIKVTIPTKLNRDEKKAFENLASVMKDDNSFINKIKKFLRD